MARTTRATAAPDRVSHPARPNRPEPRTDDQRSAIAFLTALCATAGPVERIDTHAGVILLAGEHAWKLKRAVRLPYLDFTTVDRRKAACAAEIELNRRTAPDLYLGLHCIGRDSAGELALDAGEPIEWAVLMRRFPADGLLDTMARQGTQAPGLIRDLADRIAAFHATADVQRVDGAARVRRVIEGNRTSLAALAPGLLSRRSSERLYRKSLQALRDCAALLDRRAADGCVRHCHGDLHLGNIYLWRGRPTLFDCLEFDPDLATIDVLYDLAFVLMDLTQRGLVDAASQLFNRYCDRTGESDGLATLPLFLSMRAAVRAHVEASASATQDRASARASRRAAARAYLSAALSFLDRPEPRLIAIGGLSGTGKSTLAQALAPHLGAAPGARVIRTDVLRKRLAGVVPEDRLPATAYTPAANAAIYRTLLDEARRVLDAGLCVVVDAVFADSSHRAAMAGVAHDAGRTFTGFWLEAPREILHRRVNARRNDASDADSAVVDKQLRQATGPVDWIRTSAAGSSEDVVALALSAIDKPRSRTGQERP
jgi:aminoglycoside phosphotransferase family enzyme/predicted kinase